MWNDDALAGLRVKNGFRLRGEAMTRLETFTDAAFAFAVTLLVISVDSVPENYAEFVAAIDSVPTFIACFMQLMLFWWGHHTWSRRYGLEEGWDIVFSLALVASVLIYVYPLRVIFSAFFLNFSGGTNDPAFTLSLAQIGHMYLVFGVGFSVLSGLLVVHYVRALKLRERLALDAREVLETRADILGWGVVCATGLVATLVAIMLPDGLKPTAGFVYWTLIITMPAQGLWVKRARAALAQAGETNASPTDD